MKKKTVYTVNGKRIEREVNYIPVRYIIAMMITVFEILAIIGVVVALCYFVPYFYLAVLATQICCVVGIIATDDNPDYKIPWLLFVMILPIAGFMLYFLFYKRNLNKKFRRRLEELFARRYEKDDSETFTRLHAEDPTAATQAQMLCSIADTRLFTNTKQEYFSLGEEMWTRLLSDLRGAQKFIFMEYFIVEEGKFWNSILEILKEKAADGLEVKVVYDDIGCMSTLPGNYAKRLKKFGIEATPFSRLRGSADGEFNNRSHRKNTVIDGVIAYTGGVNIADEYINEVKRFGHWKDVGVRLEGDAVWEMTRLFLVDYGMNVKRAEEWKNTYFPNFEYGKTEQGYVIPFGDGPKPIYSRNVGKSVILNLLSAATEYVDITTPYLILDNELCSAIENTALRGVRVRIILPHIPDKKLVFEATRSFYKRFLDAGVEIYEYTPGFIHAKIYLVDGQYAMIGTINLDYRSLVHHFENGVWMYRCDCIKDVEKDIRETVEKSEKIEREKWKVSVPKRMLRSLVRIFAPLL